MIATIETLTKDSNKLQNTSENAVKLAASFDWKIKIKDWEEVILELINE